jgi:hypothetical protein
MMEASGTGGISEEEPAARTCANDGVMFTSVLPCSALT